MRQKKRIVSLLLCLVMLLTMVPFSAIASAATQEDADGTTVQFNYADLVEKGLDPAKIDKHLYGDYNNDRVVSAADARIALRTSVGLETHLFQEQIFVMDIDQDGTVTSADARSILRMAVRLDSIVEILVINQSDKPSSTSIQFDEGVFSYDEESNVYTLLSDLITGTVSNTDASKIGYSITDDKGNTISEGETLITKGEFSIEDFSFRDGNNIFSVSAYHNNKVIDSVSVTVFSTVLVNSENSLIDLEADSDKDGLIDYLEAYYGSDPLIADTDNDGLTDYLEVYYLSYDPRNVDTDNNGINDDSEDADKDGLSNQEEQNLGTNPAYYDTDHDTVSDYDELYIYHTDPLKADTDGDGVEDGIEIANKSDPLTIETDFSSTALPDKTSESMPVSAGATVLTDADGMGTLMVNQVNTGENPLITSNIPGYLGSAYSFETEGELKSATITFEYDESLGQIGEDFQPRIYYLNEETGEFEELNNQKVTNGTVSADVEHFSTYILLNKVEFDKVWETDIKPVDYTGDSKTGIDIVFAIDSSGSMSWNDGSGIRKEAVKKFIEKLGENDRAAVVDFDYYASVYQDFTSDHALLNSAVDRIDYSGGTSLSAGMSTSIALFTDSSYTRTDAYKYIVFLTDGDGDYYSSYTTSAFDNGIVVYTVGLGDEVQEYVLKDIANGTGGKYFFASVADNLLNIYYDVSIETVDYVTDSNNDGISDYYTKLIDEGTLVLSNGSNELFGVLTLFGVDSDDWDGDGLKNGEEIEVIEGSNGPTIKMKSHPLHADYDKDGFNDLAERNMGTDPFAKTRIGGLMVNGLLDDGQSTSSLIGNHSLWEDITLSVYADKKKDAKNKLADFFYKYASEESQKNNKESIEKAEKIARVYKTIETLTNLAKLGKGIADLAVKYEVNTGSEEFKKSVQDIEAQRGLAFKDSEDGAESGWDKLAKKEGDILGIITSWDDYIGEVQDAIEGKKSSGSLYDITIDEINNDAKFIKSTLSAVKSAVSFFKLWKASGSKTIGKSLTKVSGYAARFGKSDIFRKTLKDGTEVSLDAGTYLDIGFAVLDYANDVMDIAETYSKVQANSEAFTEYFETLEYISSNNSYDYIRDAAAETLELALGSSSEYWWQLAEATSEEYIKDFVKLAFDLGIDAVAASNPVIAVLKAVLDIAVGELTAVYKVEIEATTVDAITDACKHYLFQTVSVSPDGTWYDIYDEEMFNHYIVHLVHGRIEGENIVYSHCDEIGLFSKAFEGWRILFTGRNRIQETKDNCLAIIQGNYKRANYLQVKYSKKLPFYSEYHTLTY